MRPDVELLALLASLTDLIFADTLDSDLAVVLALAGEDGVDLVGFETDF